VRSGKVIIATSGVQILGCFTLGLMFFLLIGLPLGGGRFDALYLAMAVSLSSTVIIVKVLYDKFELDTPGRITPIPGAAGSVCNSISRGQPSLDDYGLAPCCLWCCRRARNSVDQLPPALVPADRAPAQLVLVGALAWCASRNMPNSSAYPARWVP
jgi:hypothetical protein